MKASEKNEGQIELEKFLLMMERRLHRNRWGEREYKSRTRELKWTCELRTKPYLAMLLL